MLSVMPEINRSIVLFDERIYLPASSSPWLTEGECVLLHPIGRNLKEALSFSLSFSPFPQ